jgi:hypothetical protein
MSNFDFDDKNIVITRVGNNVWNIRPRHDIPGEGYIQLISSIVLTFFIMHLTGVVGCTWFFIILIPAAIFSVIFQWTAVVIALAIMIGFFW